VVEPGHRLEANRTTRTGKTPAHLFAWRSRRPYRCCFGINKREWCCRSTAG